MSNQYDKFQKQIKTVQEQLLSNKEQKYDRRTLNLADKYALIQLKKTSYLRHGSQDEPKTTYENDIFVDGKNKTIFLPAYMRIKLKNIHSINLEELTAEVNCDIIFSIFYGQLREKIVDGLKQKVIFLFQKNQPIKVVEIDDGKRNLQTKISTKDKYQIRYTLRKILKTKIQGNILRTPFNVLHMILSITVQPITVKLAKDKGGKQEKWTIKINLMDHGNNYQKFSFIQKIEHGDFKFAPALSRCFFSNKKVSSYSDFQPQNAYKHQSVSIDKFEKHTRTIQDLKLKLFKSEQQEDELQTFTSRLKDNFQYAHFDIPMYRVPYQAIVTIFLPLLLLAIINLCIFFQNEDLSSRIGSIASLMIAFVALVPTVRQKVAPSPSITVLEILVYMQTLNCLLTFIHSMNIRGINNYDMDYREDGLFIACLILNLIVVADMIWWLYQYEMNWQPGFRKYEYPKEISFKRHEWFNTLCYENLKGVIHSQKKHYSQYKQLVAKKD